MGTKTKREKSGLPLIHPSPSLLSKAPKPEDSGGNPSAGFCLGLKEVPVFHTPLANLSLVSPFPQKRGDPQTLGVREGSIWEMVKLGLGWVRGPLGNGEGVPARFGTPCPTLPAGALAGRPCQLFGI